MSAQLCSIPDGSEEMVLSERVLVAMLEAGVDWTVDGDAMTWTGGGSVATFTRDEDELPSVQSTLPATLPTDPTTTTVPVTTTTVLTTTTTVPATTTTAPVTTTTVPPVTTTTNPPPPEGFAVSDEELPDPEMFGTDGFLRELVDRSIVVRSTPEVVIPIDVPDDELRLIGVGPENVAYIETTLGPAGELGFGSNRVLAIATAGSNTGAVYELLPVTEDTSGFGYVLRSNGLEHVFDPLISFVGSDGQPFDGDDPTFTWFVDSEVDSSLSEPGNSRSADVRFTITELATGRSFEAPIPGLGSEGNPFGRLRPLPDGRVLLGLLLPDDSAESRVSGARFAFDPATETWTRHPWS